MIKISELYSLSDISDIYVVKDDFEVYNTKTGKIKKATENVRDHYLYYTLTTKSGKNKKVNKHKIIALAFIKNAPYEVINHLDGDKQNNHPSNLEFTTIAENTRHAFENKLIPEKESAIYELELLSGEHMVGTMQELSELAKIPIMTLYDNTYKNRKSIKIKYIHKI